MTLGPRGWRAGIAMTAALFAIASPLAAGTAHAATAYRYWTYYIGHGTSWDYSQRGPAVEYPADGEVQGWRFAVQTDAAGGLTPRAAPTFATLCASKPAKVGQLRVAVVVDFGNPGDAPPHEKPPAGVVPGCVYVPDGASGATVLEAAAAVRIGTGADAGLVCGIDNYPKTECATVVTPSTGQATPTPTLTPTPTPTSTSKGRATPTAPTAISAAAPSAGQVTIAPAATSLSPSLPATAASVPRTPAAPAAVAVPSTLAELRASTHRRQHLPASAIIGAALVVLLGGAAVWRARAGRS